MTNNSHTTTKLEFDQHEAKRFLDALCQGDSKHESFAFQTFSDKKAGKGDPLAEHHTLKPNKAWAKRIEGMNNRGAGVFVTVNRTNGNGRTNKDVTAVRSLFLDLDGAPLQKVREWSIPPHIITESSSGKYHVYWLLDEGSSVSTLKDFEELQQKLAVKFNGDPSMGDLSQVLRLPGSWHLKGEPVQVRIVEINNDDAYDVEMFHLMLSDIEVPESKAGKPKGERKSRERCRSVYEFLSQEALYNIELWAPTFFPDGRWSSGAWRVPSSALCRECQEDLVIHPVGIKDFGTEWNDRPADKYTASKLLQAFFVEGGDGQPEPVTEFDQYGSPQGGSLSRERAGALLAEALGLEWEELVQEFRERKAEGFEYAAGTDDNDDDARRTITIKPGRLSDIATEAETVLIQAKVPIFVHAEELQRPVVDEVEASKGRRTHVARFTTITTDAMRDQLSRAANWEKWSVRANGYVAADPPRDVAAIVLSRKGEWMFPQATGIITTPTLRTDGSILSTEGYDPATRLLLMRPPRMPDISAKPGRMTPSRRCACSTLSSTSFPSSTRLLVRLRCRNSSPRSCAARCLSLRCMPIVRPSLAAANLSWPTSPPLSASASRVPSCQRGSMNSNSRSGSARRC
jgi:RepB DNA-primase from phage plasmid